MIHREPTLPHHLLEVAVRELVSAIPANASKDDRRLEGTPLERRLKLPHEYDSRGVIDGLKGG
jgi:hypothetical protein